MFAEAREVLRLDRTLDPVEVLRAELQRSVDTVDTLANSDLGDPNK